MITRATLAVLALALLCPAQGYAQAAAGGGYVSVVPALSAGDGGAAPAVSVSAGYVTPSRIGFEVEFSYTDRLDLRDEGQPRIQFDASQMMFGGMPWPFTGTSGVPITTIFPPMDLGLSGRLVTFQTNGVGEIVTTRRFRAIVAGGGGIATLRQRMHMRIALPALPLPAGMPYMNFEPYDRVLSASDTGLSLGAGMTMEYRLTRRLGLAGDIRYQHVFVDPAALDLARVGTRLTWRF